MILQCFRFCQVFTFIPLWLLLCMSFLLPTPFTAPITCFTTHITQHPISYICMARPCTYTLSINATTQTLQRTQTWRTYSHTSAYTPAHILFIWASHAASSISYTHTSMGALRFVTWNVNGAGSREKKLKIFSQLKKLQADVVLLQETHRPATATDQLKTTEFPNVFTACYNSRQRG